eukprot:1357089-Amorphochlora_amoeboformis.AAC.1
MSHRIDIKVRVSFVRIGAFGGDLEPQVGGPVFKNALDNDLLNGCFHGGLEGVAPAIDVCFGVSVG